MLAGLAATGLTGLPNDAAARPVHRVSAPARRSVQHRPLVLIDPGHGGKDPGCIGVTGVEEKRIALLVALELRRQLQAAGKCRVAMTRETDEFIPLSDRVACAQRLRAALSVSLHLNASPHRAARGASVYRFAWRASDAHAASVARWENSVSQQEDLRGTSETVMHILSTLMRRETQVHAVRLQRAMVARLGQSVPMLPQSDPHARFAVLSAPDVPGVLVEMGFLTNPHEEAQFGRVVHRALVARAMAGAIDTYLQRLPVHERG